MNYSEAPIFGAINGISIILLKVHHRFHLNAGWGCGGGGVDQGTKRRHLNLEKCHTGIMIIITTTGSGNKVYGFASNRDNGSGTRRRRSEECKAFFGVCIHPSMLLFVDAISTRHSNLNKCLSNLAISQHNSTIDRESMLM